MTTPLRLLPDLEEALRQLPGIKAASVVTRPDATPTEVHVLATTDKTPKQVVRDVQSLAMARYDLDIDHRIVSVVQFDDPTDGVVRDELEEAHRPVMTELVVRTTGTEAEASISLSVAGRKFEGTATGVMEPGGPATARRSGGARGARRATRRVGGGRPGGDRAPGSSVSRRVRALVGRTAYGRATGDRQRPRAR